MPLAAPLSKTVLVTGAAGVMGSRLVNRLLGAGWRVRALVLPGDAQAERLERAGCDIWEADVADAEAVRGACAGIDTVYHLAAIILSHDVAAFRRVNVGGTANLVAEAEAAAVRHFIYVSSASVTYPELTPYAQSKLDAETLVSRGGSLAYTIVRPTLVYEENGGQELLLFLRYLQRFPVVPFIGNGRAKKRPVWAEDVVDGLVRLAGHAHAHGKIYNLSGAEPITMIDLAKLLLDLSGTPRPIVQLPVALCTAFARALAWTSERPFLTTSAIAGIIHDADLDPSRAMCEIGYRPVGVREGLARCFASRRAVPLVPPESEPTGGRLAPSGQFGMSPSQGSLQ